MQHRRNKKQLDIEIKNSGRDNHLWQMVKVSHKREEVFARERAHNFSFKPQQNVRESFGLPRVIQLIRSEAQESPSRDEKAEEERKGCC